MPAFSPTIGKFGDVTARGNTLTLWLKHHKKSAYITLASLFVITSAAFGWWAWQSRYVPAPGGTLVEGMVGYPQRLNPLYSSQNDVDAELTPLIFRALMRYDDKQELVPDLAEKIDVSEDGTIYHVTLGKNFWHDGQPVTAKDVAYTIKSTQDQGYTGAWSGSFKDVAVEMADDQHLTLTLKEPYAAFTQNLTIGLLPQHLLAGKSASDLSSNEFNLRPVGSGKLRFESLQMNTRTDQVEQLNFHLKDGYLETVSFRFYPAIQAVLTDFKLGKVQSFGAVYNQELSSLENIDKRQFQDVLKGQSYGLFFNVASEAVKDGAVRKSLAFGLPKEDIMKDVLHGHGQLLDNVFHEGHWAYSERFEAYKYNQEEAKKLWDEAESKPETIRLLIPDLPQHKATASKIVNAWKEIGVKVSVEAKDSAAIAKNINQGSGYDVVLIGEKSRPDPDRYNNWHSTQAPPVGLNISRLQNTRVDKALEDARKALDQDERKVKYATFQDYLSRDVPVIWLYQPDYAYIWSKKIHGVKIESLWSEQDRFGNLEQWYVNMQRR
jgi:peptide/nickel transport system substrate-binding protein